MTSEDVEVTYRPRPVWPRALIFAFSIFAVIGSFWAIVTLVRTYVEPPRVGGPARMSLAAREAQPTPLPMIAAEPAPVAPPAHPAPAAPEPPADPILPYQVAAPDQPPAREDTAPSASALVAARWLPNEPAVPAVPSDPGPRGSAVEPAPAALPQENGIVGPVPLPRPRPRVAATVPPPDPPLPRPRPNGSAPASLLTPVLTEDDRFPSQ
jgi:hypothetical protein